MGEYDDLTPEERDLLTELHEEIAADASESADQKAPEQEAAAPGRTDDDKPQEVSTQSQPGAIALEADASDAEKALTDISAEKAALRKSYADGEIDRDAYDEKMDALNERLMDARLQVKQAEMYADISRRTLVKQWHSAIDQFMGRPDNAAFREGPLFNALDAEVRRMNSEEMDKFPDHMERLAEARRRVVAAAEAVLGRKAEQPARQAQEQRPRLDIPPSVDDLASAAEDSDVEFGYLDRLDGAKFDAAFSKLSQEQRERYLAGT